LAHTEPLARAGLIICDMARPADDAELPAWIGPGRADPGAELERRNVSDGASREHDHGPELLEIEHWREGVASATVDSGSSAEWALAVRPSQLPMVVLAWDLGRIEQLAVTGGALAASLRLDGFSGGSPLETVRPPRATSVSVGRRGSVLQITTRHGQEPLALGIQPAARSVLQLAAHQRQLLLIVGERLGLGSESLDRADRDLRYGEALAAAVAYRDDELAALPLRPGRARRLARGLRSVMPSERRRVRVGRTLG
jgi:hypothetical protein